MEKVILPNVRRMFTPDPGMFIVDADLSGADAQVVAWEAEDEDLKTAFRAGLKVHEKNATDMWGSAYTKLSPDDPQRKKLYKDNKQAVHATNYGARPKTVAATLGWTVHEADTFQKRWFSLHPGIKRRFHGGVERELQTTRTTTNKFRFSITWFDRIEAIFPEALAWKPQSSVAQTTIYGALAVEAKFPWVEFLLQVHDSLVFQIPLSRKAELPEIVKALHIPIPYDDPLTIGWGVKTSESSWGECG